MAFLCALTSNIHLVYLNNSWYIRFRLIYYGILLYCFQNSRIVIEQHIVTPLAFLFPSTLVQNKYFQFLHHFRQVYRYFLVVETQLREILD